MQIIINDVVMQGFQTMFHTLSLFKDAIITAVFINLDHSVSGVLQGNFGMLLSVIGSIILVWRLKSWLLGFFYHSFTHYLSNNVPDN